MVYPICRLKWDNPLYYFILQCVCTYFVSLFALCFGEMESRERERLLSLFLLLSAGLQKGIGQPKAATRKSCPLTRLPTRISF